MNILTNLIEERIGYFLGYTSAFVVDKFVKVNAIRYGYRAIDYIAIRTKIPPLTPQVLFFIRNISRCNIRSFLII